ncbi:transcriptional regulator [Trichonephila inaurata madagascariensis]|uniref:Transcriptional regulator n=1 Tax=Trichonephila inaurata madagascariensis TaxID=2747483 RepID=A0A8X6WS93_9ARAC|nr:transcriptional regulator [Trichonephila inaurata madagascariensis]
MSNFIEKTKGRKAIYALTKSIRAEEESAIKAARIRMARNMLKAGFANIIYRATGLSVDECENKEEKSSKCSNKRDGMKKWRIIRGYTQEELAKELDTGGPQIHYYEQGSTMFGERLWEIARKLSVNAEDLVTGENCCEDEDTDNEGEKELLSWARELQKINNQESRDELDIWIEFLSQRRQIYKKIDKAEGIKVANNLRNREQSGGGSALFDREIVAVLLGAVHDRKQAQDVANNLMDDCPGIGEILGREIDDLKMIDGMTEHAIECVKEAYKRALREGLKRGPVMDSQEKLIEYVRVSMSYR